MKLTDTLSLPATTATQTLAILAQKGAGKTYLARKLTEELLLAHQQVVCLDPTGVWWGLRAGPTGDQSEGLSIIIMGGNHADVPLQPDAGEIVAEFIVTTGQSVVLDLSLFESKAAQNRFLTALAERLYRLKAKTEYKTPLHLMLDEADQFVPQKPQPGEQRMLGAFEAIVRQGRSRGLGMTMISQRAAVVNKNVLTQIDALMCLRNTGKHDIDTLKAWVSSALHTKAQADEFIASLPTLQVGEMWFWSPGWLMKFERGQVLPISTYDSSRTPDASTPLPTVQLRPVDLSALTTAIQASTEQAKENDPAELKRTITDLRRQLAEKPQAERVEVHVITPGAREAMETLRELLGQVLKAVPEEKPLNSVKLKIPTNFDVGQPVRITEEFIEESREARRYNASATNGTLPKCERAILTVLAQLGTCGRSKIALISDYSARSSTFGNGLSSLRTKGYIAGSDPIDITEAGLTALGPFERLPTGLDCIRHYRASLPKCEGAILAVLLDKPGHTATKQTIAETSGYSVTSSTFGNGLSALRTRELITGRDLITLVVP